MTTIISSNIIEISSNIKIVPIDEVINKNRFNIFNKNLWNHPYCNCCQKSICCSHNDPFHKCFLFLYKNYYFRIEYKDLEKIKKFFTKIENNYEIQIDNDSLYFEQNNEIILKIKYDFKKEESMEVLINIRSYNIFMELIEDKKIRRSQLNDFFTNKNNNRNNNLLLFPITLINIKCVELSKYDYNISQSYSLTNDEKDDIKQKKLHDHDDDNNNNKNKNRSKLFQKILKIKFRHRRQSI